MNVKTMTLLPDDHKYLTFLKKVFRHEFRRSGFRRLSVPNFETREFYENIFGENVDEYVYTNDIDNFGKYCLKPNSEILNLKTYIEREELNSGIQPVYSYFMDRYYPKNKDYVQGLNLFGADVVGEDDPIIDAQMIYLTGSFLNKIGLAGEYEIKINSIGSKKEQEKIKDELKSFYENKKHNLSEESIKLLDVNPIKLLASKEEDEIILAESAPKTTKFLKKDSKKHYALLKEYLEVLEVEYSEDNSVVGDYDYINNSVWEFRLKETGKVISSGYRYNSLSTLVGADKEIPGSGFSFDTWNIIEILKSKGISIKDKDTLDLYFVQLGDEAKKAVLPLSLQAREAGINTSTSLGTPSMKEQMLKASRSGARYVVMVGIMEARSGVFQVRDMEEGTQAEIKKEDLISYIVERVGKEGLDFYEPSRDLLTK